MTAVIRTIILYLLIIVGIRLMGKRQIGELEPSELVLSLIIADLAAVPMQDFGTPLIMGVIPILNPPCACRPILSVWTPLWLPPFWQKPWASSSPACLWITASCGKTKETRWNRSSNGILI